MVVCKIRDDKLFYCDIYYEIQSFSAGHESGAENGLYNHEVCISSDHYTPVMDDWIPTGEIANVGSNPVYDLRIPKRLGDILPLCQEGFAHNFLTNPMLVKNPNLDDMR